jgi:AraC family transcriptional regulator
MIHKYGLPLTGPSWLGFPMRAGHFPSEGKIEDLTSPSDTVLFWTGAPSEVQLGHRFDEGPASKARFQRQSGMFDLLPRGISLDSVQWQAGAETSCVSVNFPEQSVQQLFGANAAPLPLGDIPKFAVSDSHVSDLIQRLHAQATSGNPLGASYAQGLSLTLVSYVFSRYGKNASTAPPSSGRRLERVQAEALKAFVEEFLAQDIGLIDMAAVAGYSPDHFSRCFRETFGVSPYRYLLNRRVERAKSMLRDRSLSITTIASACGFAGQSHLNAVFKRIAGTTPGKYRKG